MAQSFWDYGKVEYNHCRLPLSRGLWESMGPYAQSRSKFDKFSEHFEAFVQTQCFQCFMASIVLNIYIIIYHCISLYIIIYHYISLYIIIYHYISLYIIIYHYISLYIIIYHYISLYIIIYNYIYISFIHIVGRFSSKSGEFPRQEGASAMGVLPTPSRASARGLSNEMWDTWVEAEISHRIPQDPIGLTQISGNAR